MLNYSWTYSGIWTLAKYVERHLITLIGLRQFYRRLLPASSLEKVFFPSQDELRCYFSSASLPAGTSIRYSWSDMTAHWIRLGRIPSFRLRNRRSPKRSCRHGFSEEHTTSSRSNADLDDPASATRCYTLSSIIFPAALCGVLHILV